MAEKKCLHYEWDEAGFRLPAELCLGENAGLSVALRVFYAADGYDFFKVEDPRRYADKWLEFVGDIYSDIMGGKYKDTGEPYNLPLTDKQRRSLIKQKIPAVFTEDKE